MPGRYALSSRGRVYALILCAWLAATAWPGAEAKQDADPFPRFESIAPNVAFWRDVFARYTLGQVVVHDARHPALVYEVVALPGVVDERYTDEQRQFVRDLRDAWTARLEELERRLDAGAEPSDADKELALSITSVCGTDGLRDAGARVRVQRGLRERFRRGLEIGSRYDALLREAFREQGLPEDLALLPHVESSFQSHARSSAGALGVWQFTRGTGRRYLIVSSGVAEGLAPVLAARGAARYLREAYEALGDWALAVTSYNHGIQGMVRARERFGTDFERIVAEYDGRAFGFASRNFYAEFLAAREIALDPGRFFPEGLTPEARLERKSVKLDRAISPGRLARLYRVDVERLAEVNPAWHRRAIQRNLALPPGLEVWIPEDASAPQVTEEPDGDVFYVVRRGDSLWTIAEMYGVDLDHLRALNDMDSRGSRIYPGQRLRIFEEGEEGAPEFLVHHVSRGETLIKIAAAYGVRLADLLALNRITTHTVIHPGQQLRIPSRR